MESYQRETERRIARLEENDEKIFDSLEEIKNTQHSQNLINQKMDFTLDSINREREIDKENKETNKKNIREMKMYVIGLVGTIVGSLIIAILRTLFGI
ncbi:DUF2951 family protein [Staphylococcus chromogenes]|uniref:DUF2951 family protein n=1 Tax=Staphylococcus chromogenes TaxID=46126 RepID=UPI00288772E9|nr:DUF2951 family protein [Staphylococcus chromogenes]MDT0715364.1 DUF2951 family protein [Staphylococcus chromogenes]MDT0747126.1 DUF2951 family protein [Staphylococcus chromogenes]MDU0465815.1 DUF2951 family protein [Staphylococcus chromogenes]